MKKIFFTLLLAMFSLQTLLAEEITLFNEEGYATAYIATDDDLTLYMWNGRPVAYLSVSKSNGDVFDIYGFNGRHLGWFEDGIVRDHKGYMVGFIKGAIKKYTHYEPYKRYKKYKPYKEYKIYPPYKPYNKRSFSSTPLSIFLMRGQKG